MSIRRGVLSLLAAVLVACGHPAVHGDTSGTLSPEADQVLLARIVDAELWVLRIGDREVKVRLIGVDVRFPTIVGCAPSEEPLPGLVAGDRLRLELDSRAEDDQGRTWVWLWSGEELINAAILRSGLATLSRYWPNQRNETALLRAQLSAARARRGLWGRCAALRRVVEGDGSDRPCDPSYPGPCVPPFPPDLDCDQIRFANFRISGPDLHDLDGDGDGLGCERYNPM